MDYPLEQLGPERFQQFVQALLIREFPNVQCFPVAQPDGGRDAVSYYFENSDKDSREFIVFQVKFVRNPHSIAEPHQWLTDVVQQEAPKISRLVPKGASKFLLITNVSGTSHLDSGSMDRVAKALKEGIHVPAQCWWRDDLNRRLDDAWNLKWTYPELMTGPDLLRAIIDASSADGRERRSAAIRAFIAHQHELDAEVKFRQVDLQNRLLELFVDVPAGPPQFGGNRRDQFRAQRAFEHIVQAARARRGDSSASQERESVGAATLLLDPLVQESIDKIVLEGAPGQGKSTITQYVCQVHRMRLLALDEVSVLPPHHATSPRRLPIKADLRDLAAWISGRSPFTPEPPAPVTQRSLEAFLASMISHQSGGVEFSVADLHAIGKQTAILLVFDGLDEVADIARRREVVDEILVGVHRLEANCPSLQVVVTSRPAAFANSPGMPRDRFFYFHLAAVDRNHINEYTGKWIRARRLPPKEGSEVRNILKEKLDQPHLRDLARNPMQLAILLSLIHTRGSSLPDKRTSLYDSYVDLFFNREAEKSAVVRKYRELLVNIHRYLAWFLHTASERGNDSGAIADKKLRSILDEYLRHEGHDPSLVGELFTGMIERVVALVSRVQGTYEFEVQPLREYFAARYLYETAPYSPPGNPQKGTKPDRFDAIARNFYWFNVTRFYAGCYSKGELPSLIDRVTDLAIDPLFSLTSHPPLLAATLLADYVFTQHPKSVKAVIRVILSGMGLRYVLSSTRRQVDSSHALILPDECGRGDLIAHAISLLSGDVPRDYALDLVDLIKANSNPAEIYKLWRQALHKVGDVTKWLDYGRYLGVLHMVSGEQLVTLVQQGDSQRRRIGLFSARRFDYFASSAREFSRAVQLVLDGDVVVGRQRRPEHLLEAFSAAMIPSRYNYYSVIQLSRLPMREIWTHTQPFAALDTPVLSQELIYPAADGCRAVLEAVNKSSACSGDEWLTSLGPWNVIVEEGRGQFGDQWAFLVLANVAAGIRSAKERSSEAKLLFDTSTPLCARLRYARLRAGQPEWWARQFSNISGKFDRYIVLLSSITWCSFAAVRRLLPAIEREIAQLNEEEWDRLLGALRRSHELPTGPSRTTLLDECTLSPRAAAVLFLRTKSEELFARFIATYDGSDPQLIDMQQEWAIETLAIRRNDWRGALEVVSKAFKGGALSRRFAYPTITRWNGSNAMPEDVAQEVVRNAELYPGYVVAMAQDVCRAMVAAMIVPVGEIAEREQWFG